MTRTKVAIDFNISPRIVGALTEMYGHHGFEFMHLQSLVSGKTADTVWAEAYRRFGGRLVISGDCRIAYRPHEAVAFIDNGLVSVFPDEAWSNLKGNEKAALLTYHWPTVAERLRAVTEGSCWKIPVVLKGRELRLSRCDLKQMEIPANVLESARRRKV